MSAKRKTKKAGSKISFSKQVIVSQMIGSAAALLADAPSENSSANSSQSRNPPKRIKLNDVKLPASAETHVSGSSTRSDRSVHEQPNSVDHQLRPPRYITYQQRNAMRRRSTLLSNMKDLERQKIRSRPDITIPYGASLVLIATLRFVAPLAIAYVAAFSVGLAQWLSAVPPCSCGTVNHDCHFGRVITTPLTKKLMNIVASSFFQAVKFFWILCDDVSQMVTSRRELNLWLTLELIVTMWMLLEILFLCFYLWTRYHLRCHQNLRRSHVKSITQLLRRGTGSFHDEILYLRGGHFARTPEERLEFLRKCVVDLYVANNARVPEYLSQATLIDSLTQPPETTDEPLCNISEQERKYRIAVMRDFITRWFHNAPFEDLRDGNVREFMAWAFFDVGWTLDSAISEDMDFVAELDTFMKISAREAGVTEFPPGYDDNVSCTRINLDPLNSYHRPLLFYSAAYMVDVFTHATLLVLGFTRRMVITNVPAHDENSQPTKHRHVVYERLPSTHVQKSSSSKRPIVFVHGIGFGLFQYLHFIACFPRSQPVYLILWPHISNQLHATPAHIPDIPDHLELMRILLRNHPPCCMVAQSFGTTSVSWLIRIASVRHLVHTAILIDPVSVLLQDPNVAISFCHRIPRNVPEVLLEFFAAREIHVANVLSGGHFKWSFNTLFAADVREWLKGRESAIMENERDPKRIVFILCGRDCITPARRVRTYLKRSLEDLIVETSGHTETATPSRNPASQVELVYFDTLAHGDWLWGKQSLLVVVRRIYEGVGLSWD
ncbi:hypothetical protein BJ742DRAFT_843586 [Cladochytrium replicatum]|nr:hypothetical protein BJ742DRAFT_843586 [Cladochytrium replicatum]